MKGRRIIFIGLFVAVFIYFFYEVSDFLFFPRLSIVFPQDGSELFSTLIDVRGKTGPNQVVFVNGKEFTATSDGIFEGVLSLAPGYNVIAFSASDRFGNETRKIAQIVIK